MDFLFPTPEAIAEMQARHEMLQEDWRNRVRQMIDIQTPENLVVLRDLLSQMSQMPQLVSYYEGVLASALIHKYPDRCEGCGDDKNHGERPLDGHTGELHSIRETEKREVPLDEMNATARREMEQADVLINEDGSLNEAMISSEPMENLKAQFDLYEVYPEDPDEPLSWVRCNNCGTRYVSLKDRMVREPGKPGCGTCVQKEKWG